MFGFPAAWGCSWPPLGRPGGLCARSGGSGKAPAGGLRLVPRGQPLSCFRLVEAQSWCKPWHLRRECGESGKTKPCSSNCPKGGFYMSGVSALQGGHNLAQEILRFPPQELLWPGPPSPFSWTPTSALLAAWDAQAALSVQSGPQPRAVP